MSDDILERAKKALIDDDMTYEDYDECISLLIAEVERLQRLMDVVENTSMLRSNRLEEQIEALVIQKSAKAARIKELEAEVEAKNKQIKELQDLIDKPPEEADWAADYHLLQSALDGPIIDAARKWHAAYRKAQNSNLMRAKEVERLRAAVGVWEKANSDLIAGLKAGAKEVIAKDARIKELETDRRALMSNNVMTDYLKRLEAAFLKSETERKFYTTINGMNSEFDWNGYPECPQNGIHKEWFRQQAREALEELRHG